MAISGCQAGQSQTAPTETEPAFDEAAIREKATPMLDELLTALSQNDYATFSKNFNEKMKASVSRESFEALQATLAEKYGAYQSIEYQQMASAQGYLNIYYSATFEKGTMTVQFVLDRDPPNKIAGLWFR